MHDKGKVVIGIIVFLAVVSFPFWYTAAFGEGGAMEALDEPRGDRCIAPRDVMRATHMEILDDWRDSVVRDGKRMVEVEGLGMKEMSLTRTCLECHTSKKNFCDRCHDYADVKPYCWDCHIIPEGK